MFFCQSDSGGFMWPGFGENSRVLEWIFNRTTVNNGDLTNAQESPIGLLPSPDAINLNGLNEEVDMDGLFSLPKEFWSQEVEAIATYFDEQVPDDLPQEIADELSSLKERIEKM